MQPCTPHPHQPGPFLPSSLNVRQKAAVATLCTLCLGPLDRNLSTTGLQFYTFSGISVRNQTENDTLDIGKKTFCFHLAKMRENAQILRICIQRRAKISQIFLWVLENAELYADFK